jgi:hypothetical protein
MAITLTLMDTVAFAAVGDPYNQPVYQGSAGYIRPVGWTNSSPSGLHRLLIMVRSMA